MFFSTPLFQFQDSRSRADFEGTHILAGPTHGGQGWVVITEFKLAALEVVPLKQCHAAVTVVLRHRKIGVRPSKVVLMNIFSAPLLLLCCPTQVVQMLGSASTLRVYSISILSF